MFSEKKYQEAISALRAASPQSKIYFGCDSKRKKVSGKWYATYTGVVVIHHDGNKGCRIVHESVTEPDYDFRPNRPSMRLMNEVYKVCELYLMLEPVLRDRIDVEIHLDISLKKECNSSIVVQSAIGYVTGMLGIIPKVKPEALAASYAADMIEAKSCHHVAPVG